MRNTLYIFVIIFIFSFGTHSVSKAQSGQELMDICGMIAGDATYLKDYEIKLEEAKTGEEPPKAIFSFLLTKNMVYKFSICNSKDYPGKAIVSLYDNNRILGTSYQVATGKYYPSFNFKCSKTGVYHVFIRFKDGEQGLALTLLSLVEAL
ncbi:MAG: hypothetical protein U9R54_10140 [Bacteroidota bacterium]|nr:hypothetical protein [Bacteroidota bacterium]